MLAVLGNRAVEIKRIETGGVYLGDLPEGHWRLLQDDEVKLLNSRPLTKPHKIKSPEKSDEQKKFAKWNAEVARQQYEDEFGVADESLEDKEVDEEKFEMVEAVSSEFGKHVKHKTLKGGDRLK